MKMLPRYEDVQDFVQPIALPQKDPSAPKICLVLDLDETLVHCTVEDIPHADMKFPVRVIHDDQATISIHIYIYIYIYIDFIRRRMASLF
jgi:hypothetical protein